MNNDRARDKAPTAIAQPSPGRDAMTIPDELRRALLDLGLIVLPRENLIEILLDPTRTDAMDFLRVLVAKKWHLASYVDTKFLLACAIMPGADLMLEQVVQEAAP